MDKTKSFEQVADFAKQNGRICPQPQIWNNLYNSLKDKTMKQTGVWEPPLPLILAAWWDTSDFEKQQRFLTHLKWGEAHNQLNELFDFLLALTEDQWHHQNE